MEEIKRIWLVCINLLSGNWNPNSAVKADVTNAV